MPIAGLHHLMTIPWDLHRIHLHRHTEVLRVTEAHLRAATETVLYHVLPAMAAAVQYPVLPASAEVAAAACHVHPAASEAVAAAVFPAHPAVAESTEDKCVYDRS